ncbi:golgin subfamily A member 4 [Cataglyphis hispanica]|uniref:golgin subfamily A member 4 n=1 Tax=Cataglyphis hispanica TaxID=1086592 RepID=UPI00217F7C52|nr:golgin subfamily A member 4 [Cataglyphis hispanica]
MIRRKKRGNEKPERKEKKVRKKFLDEHETLSYEQQILDNNKQLSRLRSRNEELEHEVKVLTKKFEQLKEDQSDVIAHLERNLEAKIEESRELSERLLALEELRKQEQAEYKKKESEMEFEYRTMENNLSAEVKLAAGKLNALEDWRLARLDLMNKFEIQEEQIAKQEELHKTTLYETEKSLIIAKAKMQKEMEERLKQLAQEFKEATNIRIANVMRNTVRRNIALNHELNTMLKVCEDLESQSAECKDNDRMHRLQSELFEMGAKIAINDAMRQKDVMHELAREHIDTILEYGRVQRENARFKNYEILLSEHKMSYEASEQKIKILERQLQETKKARQKVLSEVRIKCEEFKKLEETLKEAKQCVLEALQLQEDVCTSDICASCGVDTKQKLIYSLQNILEKNDNFDVIKDDNS